MSSKEAEFLNQLRATFQIEAAEHLQTITTGLLELEKNPEPGPRRALLEDVFRAAHSLKGAARAVDLTGIESSCQSLEDIFAAWKRQAPPPGPAGFDAAHRALNAITGILTPRTQAPITAERIEDPRSRVEAPDPPAMEAVPPPPAPVPGQKPPPAQETVRVGVSTLDARLLEAEEMLTVKLAARRRVEELRGLTSWFEAWRREWAGVETAARALGQGAEPSGPSSGPGLARLLEFLHWNLDRLKLLEGNLAALTRTAEQDSHITSRLVEDLQEGSKKLRLQPFALLALPLPKLVRDLCREQGKEAELLIHGEQAELDKRILEEMKDPLIHLLRNCVDHGVELPEARVRQGKPPRATITLDVSHVNGSTVEILVADDGAGIDTDKVKASAVTLGLLSAEEAARLDEAAARALIFQPEVSTSPTLTRVSGRGLGLAIVREKAEKLGGIVSVESRPHRGTRFRITLPSMLTTFRGILVEDAGQRFVVPITHVERVTRIKPDDILTVEGRETIAVAGRAVALARLAEVLELPRRDSGANSVFHPPAVIVSTGDQRVAFAVDAVVGEQEVLAKPFRRPLSRIRNISGATIIGSGHVVPILNVPDLLKSARRTADAAVRVVSAPKPSQPESKSVLVVEDSITSRMLLKGILESAGYKVKTAVDGMEAFTLLRVEKFDLVVSDVEMPRLNGFDLTARIRADKRLADLPVVLVTALETREDRERGIDAGANAYIVKAGFGESSLLDAVRRLA